jgi:Na+/proline symporter
MVLVSKKIIVFISYQLNLASLTFNLFYFGVMISWYWRQHTATQDPLGLAATLLSSTRHL